MGARLCVRLVSLLFMGIKAPFISVLLQHSFAHKVHKSVPVADHVQAVFTIVKVR